MSPLTWIIGWPLFGALALACVPRNYRFVARLIALATTLISMLLAIRLFWKFDSAIPGFQFPQKTPWIDALGISFHVGVDGINIGLILMGAIVAFAAAAVSWEIKEREKEFYILLLLMTGGVLGAFASLDLFFFYFFHELALVPTFIMIGVWGRGGQRNYAAFQITLYLSLGALIALIGLLALYLEAGARSFDLIEIAQHLRRQPLPAAAQNLIFPLLMFGFGILVSLWPFHTWAPLGYSAAPTGTAMLHAGILKKFGLYGLIRIAVPLLPEGAGHWLPLLACLCLGNLLYCGWVAMRQKDLNYLIGNSSVAHMGFVFLGIASWNLIGVTGAVMVMVAHGFLAALSFGLSGYLYQQTRTLQIAELGGLLRPAPFLGTALIMAMFAGCGLPGFANFIGEAMVFFGSWTVYPAITVLACWAALVVGAVYCLRAIRHVLHGPLPAEGIAATDVPTAWRKAPFALLLAVLLLFGCFPRLLIDKIKPSVQSLMPGMAEGQRLALNVQRPTPNAQRPTPNAQRSTP